MTAQHGLPPDETTIDAPAADASDDHRPRNPGAPLEQPASPLVGAARTVTASG